MTEFKPEYPSMEEFFHGMKDLFISVLEKHECIESYTKALRKSLKVDQGHWPKMSREDLIEYLIEEGVKDWWVEGLHFSFKNQSKVIEEWKGMKDKYGDEETFWVLGPKYINQPPSPIIKAFNQARENQKEENCRKNKSKLKTLVLA